MRDLAFVAFLMAFLALGLKRPFIFVLAYAYVDIVSPQHLSYYLLNRLPISMIVAALAVAGWLIGDRKKDLGVAPRQVLMLVLLVYAGFTTLHADFPVEAQLKWDWVWKAVFWAIFLPFTLRTRLRIESYLLTMVLSAASIIIVGGLKTVASGGGYGELNLMVDNNTGLYEGSQISTVAIAIIPLIVWFTRFGTVFRPDWRVRVFAYCLIFACLLIPVGTQARTGLICIAVLAVLILRDVKRRLIYLSMMGLACAAAIPFLPNSFTNRMETISTYQADQSASTRIAVWAWTWNYAKDHPMGGGFDAYRQNSVKVSTGARIEDGRVLEPQIIEDKSRAYHSSYFEMLGEQGYPGILLWLTIHLLGLLRMEIVRRRYLKREDDLAWASPLATALQSAQVVYLIGSLFVGIAWQPFIYMLLGVQIGFDRFLARKSKAASKARKWAAKPVPAAA